MSCGSRGGKETLDRGGEAEQTDGDQIVGETRTKQLRQWN